MHMNESALRPLLCLALAIPVACGDDVPGADTETSDTEGSTTDPNPPTTNNPTTGESADDTGTTSATAATDSDTDEPTGTTTGDPPGEPNIPQLVKELVEMENSGRDVEGFPLEYIPGSVELTTIPQLASTNMRAFLEPITEDPETMGPFWGSNNDFIGYIGDGWEDGGSPYFSGSGESAWMWTNFEYISNSRANPGAAPEGVGLQLVTWLADNAAPGFDFDVTDDAEWTDERVDAYIAWHKRSVGGALYRAEFGDAGWEVDLAGDNSRFDATSNTLFLLTGPIDVGVAQDDAGADLPPNVVPGTSSNCSGGVTPWGTFVSAEENTQFGYGDLQSCWTSSNVFIEGGPCDSGSDIVWDTTPSENSDFTRGTAVNTRPDYYSYLVEIDPESPPSMVYDPATGDGHQKLGSFGRARWENATFYVGEDWGLVPDQPIVFYSGNDRRGGRIYKWVSAEPYTDGMSKAEIRNLLADGRTYVAHFADLDNSDDDAGAEGGVTVGGTLATEATPGSGVWIEMSVGNRTDTAPNAAGGGAFTTVGEALLDNDWNNLGAFPDDQTVLMGLFTAATKIGVKELNRPEDLEWNPVDGNLWIAFTNHGRPNALNDDGTLNLDDPATKDVDEHELSARGDSDGAIVVLREENPADAGASMTFTFWTAWRGNGEDTTFNATDPDNLAIDSEGGVWFGTDGNYSTETQDAIYYLEVNEDPTQSRAWRVASVPSDAEATGPYFAADEMTLFFNVQHPREDLDDAPDSDFQAFGDLGPRSGQVALTIAR